LTRRLCGQARWLDPPGARALDALAAPLQVAVVAQVLGDRAAVDHPQPSGDRIDEIPVVGNEHDRAFEVLQRRFQHLLGRNVEMIRRLVEQQQAGVVEHQLGERYPAFLPAAE